MLQEAREAEPIPSERRQIRRSIPQEENSFTIGHEENFGAAEQRQQEYLRKLRDDLREKEERRARIDEMERRSYEGFLIGKQEEEKRKSKTVRPQATSLVLSMPPPKTNRRAENMAKIEQVTQCLSPSGLVLKHAKAPTSAVPPFLYAEEAPVEGEQRVMQYDSNKPFVIGSEPAAADQSHARKLRQEQYREQLSNDIAENVQIKKAVNRYHTTREL